MRGDHELEMKVTDRLKAPAPLTPVTSAKFKYKYSH